MSNPEIILYPWTRGQQVTSHIYRYRPTRPYGRIQVEYQGHKISKHKLWRYTIMYTKNIPSLSILIFFMCVCLHYLLTVYLPMLPKHNKKLLTLLFSHIISINPQNYNLLLLYQLFWQHIFHIITRSVLQHTH